MEVNYKSIKHRNAKQNIYSTIPQFTSSMDTSQRKCKSGLTQLGRSGAPPKVLRIISSWFTTSCWIQTCCNCLSTFLKSLLHKFLKGHVASIFTSPMIMLPAISRSLSSSLTIWTWNTAPTPGIWVREFFSTFSAYKPSSAPTRTIWKKKKTHKIMQSLPLNKPHCPNAIILL